MILLIDNYDSFTYNLVHFLGELGAECCVYRNDKISVNEALSLGPQAIVISPGPRTPSEAGISIDLVQEAGAKTPILGVCLGHQTLGQAYGGKVVRAKKLMHGKLSRIIHNGTGILEGIPNEFEATRYHSLVLEADSLPNCFDVGARTEDGTIMAIQHKDYELFGLQFHPESIASEHGHHILRNFLVRAKVIRN